MFYRFIGEAEATAMATKSERQPKPRANGKVRPAAPTFSKTDLAAMPLLQDRELVSVELDAFGHRDFALLLQSLIESPAHKPPFSVGLLGPWGTGKSSIKELYILGLKDDQSKGADGYRRNQRIHTVTFNAWRYGGDNIKRALLRHVYLELGGKDATLRDALYHQIQRSFQHPKSWTDFRREMAERWLWTLLFIVVISLVAFAVSKGLELLLGSTGMWAGVGGIALTAIGGWLALSSSDVRSLIVSRYEQALRIELPRTSAEEYEDLLLGQLNEYKNRRPHCHRLVLFVDDLDRLSAEEMVSGLDAVRTFMELPVDKLPKDLGVAFVISCDEDRVASALEARRRQGAPELPAVILSRMDARRFLDRIFQFRIEIPPFPPKDLRAFAKRRIQKEMPDIAGDLQQPELGKVFDDVVDRMIHVNVQDPRNALQIVNAFAQSWRLAKTRERAGVVSGRPGGLNPGAVTDHPEALAALSAIRVNFPDFYDNLQKEPELIRYFSAFFLRKDEEGIPDRALALLRGYQAAAEESKVAAPLQVKPTYEPLRQYLVSLQGMRWPPSLQPLLLLAQDPISRQFGDSARVVRNALVSGDDQGVLAALGREHDARPLNPGDVQLLRDLQESLLHDTEVPRNNAAAAMVALADRLPVDDARSLLSPVGRRLVEIPELRWRVGVDRIGRLLPLLARDDKRDVAGSLVEDLLPTIGDYRFRTERGEIPSLDEAKATVERAIPLIMDVWREEGLSLSIESQLVEWLQTRACNVPSHGGVVFPFGQLEAWISQAEAESLGALAGAYPDLVADALEDGQDNFDIETALQRSRLVFDRLWETNRSELWQLLTRFVGLQEERAAVLAWEVMRVHPTGPDPVGMTSFLVAFGNRLIEDEENEEWQLNDWEGGARVFLALLEQRANDLREDIWKIAARLASRWSDDSASEEFAITLLELMERNSPSAATETIDEWITRAGIDLSTACVRWLGSHFVDRLSKGQRAALLAAMNSILAKSVATDNDIASLSSFVTSLTGEGSELSEIQEFSADALEQMSDSSDDYLEQIFPVIADLVPRCSLVVVGTPLMDLFKKTQSRGRLEALGVLHGAMIGNWPKPNEEVSTYDPDLLFEQAATAISQAPSSDASAIVLRSMKDMLDRGIVPASSAEQVVGSACEVWPDHSETASEVLLGLQLAPGPDQMLELGQQTEVSSENGLVQLRQVWTHSASLIDDGARLETAQLLLNETARGVPDRPDLLLDSWIDAQGEKTTGLLHQLARDDDLVDDQRARVWLQIDRKLSELDNGDLLSLLTDMLHPDIEERTLQRVLDSKPNINERFDGSQERLDLAKVLLQALLLSESANAQHAQAQWLKEVDGKAALPELEAMAGATLEHVELLGEHFKNDRTLNRLKRDFEKKSNAP